MPAGVVGNVEKKPIKMAAKELCEMWREVNAVEVVVVSIFAEWRSSLRTCAPVLLLWRNELIIRREAEVIMQDVGHWCWPLVKRGLGVAGGGLVGEAGRTRQTTDALVK